MSQVTIDQDSQIETSKTTADAAALRSGPRNIPAAGNATQPFVRRSFSERVKGILAHIAKGMEGDHESHKYRS